MNKKTLLIFGAGLLFGIISFELIYLFTRYILLR